jgi:phosphatidylethanolamine/phosphatidyl-N-methylethanolamine N-methyltransferase
VTAYADNDLIEKVYRQLAKVYDVAFGAILQSGRQRAIRAISADRQLRVLEIGIGTALTVPEYPATCTITGLDYSAAMLAKAKKRVSKLGATDRVTLLQGDAAHLPFADGLFDVVFAPYVMSVVTDPVGVGREANRVCRPDGRVVLLNHFSSERPAFATVDRVLSPLTRYVGFRTDLQLMPLLAGAGLRPLTVHSVNAPPIWKLVVCAKGSDPERDMPRGLTPKDRSGSGREPASLR